MIGQEELKLASALDLTLFVPNTECAELILQLLDRFTICSGLKVNHTKTEAIWVGLCRQNTATPLGLRWSKCVKALGIVFTYNDADQLQKHFYDKLKDIRIQIRSWNCQGLSRFEETAFSMSKIHFNANDEGTILQSNRNARMTIQYKWTQLVK